MSELTAPDLQTASAVDNPQQAADPAPQRGNHGPDLNSPAAIEVPKRGSRGGYHHKVMRLSANQMRKAKAATALLAGAGRPIVNGSSRAGLMLSAFRTEYTQDLGGESTLSLAQKTLIDLAARQKLLIDVVGASMLEHGLVVNRGRRQLYPLVREHQALIDSLVNTLKVLGIERRAGKVPSLHELLAEPATAENASP